MSLTAVRPYLRSRAKEVALTEWKDGFNSSNIPETILNKSFFIEMSDITQGDKRNQYDQEITVPCSIKIFIKGYRDPASAIDSMVLMVENFIKKCCNPAAALTQTNGILNCEFDSVRYEPINQTNDNAVMATVVMRLKVILNVG